VAAQDILRPPHIRHSLSARSRPPGGAFRLPHRSSA
jgi:hypothetical protein